MDQNPTFSLMQPTTVLLALDICVDIMVDRKYEVVVVNFAFGLDRAAFEIAFTSFSDNERILFGFFPHTYRY